MFYPVTPKQISFIKTLRRERELSAGEQQSLTDDKINGMSKTSASSAISWLLKQPKRTLVIAGNLDKATPEDWHKLAEQVTAELNGETPKPSASSKEAQGLDEGYYYFASNVYQVMLNKYGTHKYARVLQVVDDKGVWTYAKGAIALLKPEYRLTPADAKQFGDIHHFCFRCGRELTNPESIERGVGPICANELGWN